MINCECPMCSAGYSVELDLFALAQTWGVPLEVATARSWSSKEPLGITVKCPRCGHTCDIAAANTANKEHHDSSQGIDSMPSSMDVQPLGVFGRIIVLGIFGMLPGAAVVGATALIEHALTVGETPPWPSQLKYYFGVLTAVVVIVCCIRQVKKDRARLTGMKN